MSAIINLERFRELRVAKIDDFESICRTVLGELEGLTTDKKKALFAQSKKGGGVFLYRSTNPKLPEAKNVILEAVMGIGSDDFFTCLFDLHPLLNAPSELLRAREELVDGIERLMNAAPGRVVIPDPARGRRLKLQELGTQQLLDQLRRLLGQEVAKLHTLQANAGLPPLH